MDATEKISGNKMSSKMTEEKDNSLKEKTEQDHINDLWQFPCQFVFKAMAYSGEGVEDKIVSVIQRFVPGDYCPKLKPSSKGTYTAVSVTFTAEILCSIRVRISTSRRRNIFASSERGAISVCGFSSHLLCLSLVCLQRTVSNT